MRKLIIAGILLVAALFATTAEAQNFQFQYNRGVVVYPRYVPYYYYGYRAPLYFNRGFGLQIQGNNLNLQFNKGITNPYYYRFNYRNRLPGSHYFPPTPHPSNNWSK